MVSVIFLLLYKIMELESSVTMETQLKIAPDTIPLDIIGTVIRLNVFNLDAPRLIAASSILIGICWSVAVAERIVYGISLITNEISKIQMVPVKASGFEPNAITSAIPITDPGMIYGSMDIVSIVWLKKLERRTTR